MTINTNRRVAPATLRTIAEKYTAIRRVLADRSAARRAQTDRDSAYELFTDPWTEAR